MLRPLLLMTCLSLGCAGCMGDLDRMLDHSFAMACAAEGFDREHGRLPESEGELLDGAAIAGVTIERDRFRSLVVRQSKDGGVSLRWVERPGGGLLQSELRGRLDIPGDANAPGPQETPSTQAF